MLIIVESPAKAKTISKIVGKKYVVKASVGHVRGLSDQKKTKEGKSLEISGIDIDNDFSPIYEVDSAKKDIVVELKKMAKAAKDGILFATDSDREGESISWHLAEILGIKDKSKIQRLEFHEITEKAINEAIKNPRDLNLELVHAQQARQVLDKLVGYKLSPVLWNTMSNYKLSAGRVQSPALHIIAEREKEIQKFQSEEYWEIFGNFDDNTISQSKEIVYSEDQEQDKDKKEKPNKQFKLFKIKGTKIPETIKSQKELDLLKDGLKDNPQFTIVEAEESFEKSSPKAPFITSTLQQAASSKLGYNPKLTMQLAQKLYEGIDIDGSPTALITYMRTDSTTLSQEAVEAARSYIATFHPKYLPKAPRVYKSRSRNAQEAHEAIRPVNINLLPDKLRAKLDPKLFKLYELIWKQTVASQMTEEIRKRLSFVLQNTRKDEFRGSISWTIEPGFKIVTGDNMETEPKISFKQNQKLYLQEILYFQKFTQPPSRYSPASLIKKLEELGIGRPSTYASIITTLTDREYAEIKQNIIHPTTLGLKINDLLTDNFKEITSADLTAKMEESLDEISRGEKEYKQVLSDFWWDFKKEVEEKSKSLTQDKSKYKSTETDEACPVCNNKMDLRIGRFGEYYQCQTNKEHMFPKNFKEYEQALKLATEEFAGQTKDKTCEFCGKDLIVRVSKSSLKPYIACPEYQVGNKHTVSPISLGPCPKCAKEGRINKEAGVLIQKKGFRGKGFIGCSLPKETCGYIQTENR